MAVSFAWSNTDLLVYAALTEGSDQHREVLVTFERTVKPLDRYLEENSNFLEVCHPVQSWHCQSCHPAATVEAEQQKLSPLQMALGPLLGHQQQHLERGNLNSLRSGGFCRWPSRSVTFIGNHDTDRCCAVLSPVLHNHITLHKSSVQGCKKNVLLMEHADVSALSPVQCDTMQIRLGQPALASGCWHLPGAAWRIDHFCLCKRHRHIGWALDIPTT